MMTRTGHGKDDWRDDGPGRSRGTGTGGSLVKGEPSLTRRAACLDCGYLIEYQVTRFAWAHVTKGFDHAPRVP